MPKRWSQILALLVFLPVACSTPPLDDDESFGDWAQYTIEDAPPRRDLLNACEWAVIQAGFPPASRDETRGSVTSGWDTNLHPYSKKGRRWQGILKVVDNPNGEGFILKSRVIAERNMEVNDTMNPAAADWERVADEPARARILMQHVLSQLHITG